jgi:hypothetical protein
MTPSSDIGLLNLMIDESSVLAKSSHFCRPWTHDGINHRITSWRDRCTVEVQYHYIDFGLSANYAEGDRDALATGMSGQVKTVPELSNLVPYNPFKADVYQLGHTLLEVIQVRNA